LKKTLVEPLVNSQAEIEYIDTNDSDIRQVRTYVMSSKVWDFALGRRLERLDFSWSNS
jgi:hypothetical protein